jgi:hypothetical protein
MIFLLTNKIYKFFFLDLYKSNSNTIFILSPHVESFSHVESHFCNFNSNTTLYFVFIFIKIIFSLFYFNFFSLSSFFFSLSSFLFSSLCSRPTATHTTANPRQPIPRQTHGNPYPRLHHHAETKTQATVNPTPPENPNPENPSHRQPNQKIPTPTTRQTHPRQTEAQIAAETKTQTHEQTETQTHKQTQPHRQPNHHQKINKGEGRASYGEQRERTEKREIAQWRERR